MCEINVNLKKFADNNQFNLSYFISCRKDEMNEVPIKFRPPKFPHIFSYIKKSEHTKTDECKCGWVAQLLHICFKFSSALTIYKKFAGFD